MQDKIEILEQKIRHLESEMQKKISALTKIDVDMIILQRNYNRMNIYTAALEMDLAKQKVVEAENVQLTSENIRLRQEVDELKLVLKTCTVKSFITMEHDNVGTIIRF
jgi:hypothetical protein